MFLSFYPQNPHIVHFPRLLLFLRRSIGPNHRTIRADQGSFNGPVVEDVHIRGVDKDRSLGLAAINARIDAASPGTQGDDFVRSLRQPPMFRVGFYQGRAIEIPLHPDQSVKNPDVNVFTRKRVHS